MKVTEIKSIKELKMFLSSSMSEGISTEKTAKWLHLETYKKRVYESRDDVGNINTYTIVNVANPDYAASDGNDYWEILSITDSSGSILVRVSYSYCSWDEDYYDEDSLDIVEPYVRSITDYRSLIKPKE
jgi:hypothetical protein